MVEWWVLLRKTRMCSKEWLLNGLFSVFMSFWGFSFFWPGGRRGDLEHAGGAVNVIWRKPWRWHFSFIFLKGALAPFCTVVFCRNVSKHLLLWAVYHVFIGTRRLRLGSQIVWLGNTSHTHMVQISGGDDVGVALFVYFLEWYGGRREWIERMARGSWKNLCAHGKQNCFVSCSIKYNFPLNCCCRTF